jgi:hypothetical protein
MPINLVGANFRWVNHISYEKGVADLFLLFPNCAHKTKQCVVSSPLQFFFFLLLQPCISEWILCSVCIFAQHCVLGYQQPAPLCRPLRVFAGDKKEPQTAALQKEPCFVMGEKKGGKAVTTHFLFYKAGVT